MNILASISGGRSSHLMAHILRTDPKYKDCNILYCFGNTGKECKETLDFVHECEVRWGLPIVWLEAKVYHGEKKSSGYTVVNYETAARKGEPFEEVIKKYGIPNRSFPHCTRETKLNPIHTYASEYFCGDYVTAIGIRADEARRIKISSDFIYPLVERGITVAAVRAFWNNMPFDLQLKDYEGNCDFCWKKSERKILTLLKEGKHSPSWWVEMERKYADVKFESREQNDGPTYFGRRNTPMDEFIRLSKLPFIPVTDPMWVADKNPMMDEEQACACMLQAYDNTPDFDFL